VAYEVVSAVREHGAYANLLLPVRLDRAGVGGADAALATELTYGTLRMQGYYDRVIALAARRPVARIEAPVLDVLRIGVHQLLSTRVAPHAAVDEAVSLAREVGSRSAAGFVNGVLRAIGRQEPDLWRVQVLSGLTDQDEYLAASSSHPVWVVRAFRQALRAEGREEELGDLLEADNAPARVALVALPGLATRAQLPGATAAACSPLAVVSRGDPARRPQVRAGVVRVQDEGSQLAALALSRARPIVPGERWLDLCAGPGGKAALLSAEARLGGASILANELVPARARLVRQALAVFPEPPEVLEQDGRRVGRGMPGRFDRILVDAPCTGLGALRRRPEARWRKQPRDVSGLAALQWELVSSAVQALKPGGLLAYVTCSPHVAETRLIVERAVGAGLTALDTPAVLAGFSTSPLDLAGSRTSAQLWPHRHGTDAMFIALLQRARG
jgi:16S rRNA (cytosine967-C5)-methyltransferase